MTHARTCVADRLECWPLSSSGGPLKETHVHDVFAGIIFVAMVMTPCVVALTVRLED